MRRREIVKLGWAASVGLGAAMLNACAWSGATIVRELQGLNPFSLGVASGSPSANSVVLWTRLATPANSARMIPPMVIQVHWELALDEGFARVVARGVADAAPQLGHSIHVQPTGLLPQRHYWYRFRVGDVLSPVGRTMTTPLASSDGAKLRFALGSCQHWEQGYFHAWKHAIADQPDLILFSGDYIYEYGVNTSLDRTRYHDGPEVKTLEAYRARYALYKTDPSLQAAHAAVPWLMTWDDHEVSNDYASDQDEGLNKDFLTRRAAAYQAYWENLPLPIGVLDLAALPAMKIYARYGWGKLACFHMLDDRQYRDAQACQYPNRGGSSTVWRDECAALNNPNRSILGAQQEAWLNQGLNDVDVTWTLLGQQTLMARMNMANEAEFAKGRERIWTDGWDGYPLARERLLQNIQDAQGQGKARNTLVLGGDVNAWYLSDLRLQRDIDRLKLQAPVVATEICGSSITSRSWPQSITDIVTSRSPHYRFAHSETRGYTLFDLDAKRARIQLRGVSDVRKLESSVHTVAQFQVEAGRPGIRMS